MFTIAHSSAAGSIHYSHYEHYGHGGWSLTWAGTGNWCWHFQTWSHMWLHWLSPQQNWFSTRRGIEPRSPAWQAGILATILSRISPISLNAAGFEPTTFGFGIQCSANWATHPRWRQKLTMETANFPMGVPATILSGKQFFIYKIDI